MKRLLGFIFYMLAGFIAGGFVFYWTMEIWHGWLQATIVPDVLGMETAQASDVLASAGLHPSISGVGKVIGTYPRPGMRVFQGRKVEVYTSSVNLDMLLKRLKGISFEFAKDALDFLKVKYEISKMPAEGEDGRVLAIFRKDDKLYLLIDSGNPPRFFKVPDVRGMNYKSVKALLEEKQMPFKKVGEGETVVDQYPEPGSISRAITLILR